MPAQVAPPGRLQACRDEVHRIGHDPLLVAAPVLAGATLLRLRDPHIAGSYGTCPFLALTGLPCPACGGMRAVNDLTRGDLLAALSSNLYAVATFAVLALAWVAWVWSRSRPQAQGGPPVPVRRLRGSTAAHGRRWGFGTAGPQAPRASDRWATRLSLLWLAGFFAFGVLRWFGPFQGLQP